MNFSDALVFVKAGFTMKREGWNGKNQFIYLVKGSKFDVNIEPLTNFFDLGTTIKYRAHIDMKYEDGSCGVWSPSMGDLMAEDWIIEES